MTLNQLQRIFLSELSPLFPKTEIDSFFYILCNEFLNIDRVTIALNPNLMVTDKRFNNALNDLIAQKPIQYIIGHTEFYGLTFSVNNNVLIPRPETEELVSWIIEDANDHINDNLSVLDIGTGSGCIAISLAKNIKNSTVFGLDVSKTALQVAKKNAIDNKVKLVLIEADILNLTTTIRSTFNIIVSNPPYVRELEKEAIQKNVLDNEPHVALFVSNENPLLFYDAIANFALKHLTKNGVLYFEINQYLGKETVALLKKKGFKNILLKKDVFGVDRMISAKF